MVKTMKKYTIETDRGIFCAEHIYYINDCIVLTEQGDNAQVYICPSVGVHSPVLKYPIHVALQHLQIFFLERASQIFFFPGEGPLEFFFSIPPPPDH